MILIFTIRITLNHKVDRKATFCYLEKCILNLNEARSVKDTWSYQVIVLIVNIVPKKSLLTNSLEAGEETEAHSPGSLC